VGRIEVGWGKKEKKRLNEGRKKEKRSIEILVDGI
jgi:hypothetical protein